MSEMKKRTTQEMLDIARKANKNKNVQIESLTETLKALRETNKNLKKAYKEALENNEISSRFKRYNRKLETDLEVARSVIRGLVTEYEIPSNFKIVQVEPEEKVEE